MKMLRAILLLAIIAPSICAKPNKMEILTNQLQKNFQLFEAVTIKNLNQPTDFQIQLGNSPLTLPNNDVFDGFRFVAPKGSHNLDFTWYFNAPNEWGHWYISPVKGVFNPAFKDWLNADKFYRKLDKVSETNRLRVLQTLSAGYFTDGQEYIIWFRRVEKGGNQRLAGRFTFAKVEKSDDYEDLEKALGLKPQAAETQVKALDSRGGKILLDQAFFKPKYAANRIDSVFFSLRQTKRMKSGIFITMEISVPPCKTNPSYAEIHKKYGDADFIQTSAEENQVRTHAGGDIDDDDLEPITTYYYDYFGFEVTSDDKKKIITRVVTHANDFSALKGQPKGLSYGRVPMKNLTVLSKGDQEVGRFYYFLEGHKKPLCTLEPPIGKYQNGNKTLEYLGGKKWLWTTLNKDKSIARKVPFSQHLMNGQAQGFFPNGKPRFTAHYLNGTLDGELIQYSVEGKITNKDQFKKGKRVENE